MIPSFSYMACAWAGFAAYATSMVLSYFIGQRYFPIAYPIKDMTVYLLIAILLFVGIQISNNLLMTWLAISVNTLLVGVFVAYLVKKDFPLSSIPIIGKKFKK